MEISTKQREKINNFEQEYLDKTTRPNWGWMKFENKDSEAHWDMTYNICKWLAKRSIPFTTELELRTGYTPDIIAPTWVKPIIEVRMSETDKRTRMKEENIPNDLKNNIIYVDATKEFDKEMIL